MAGDSATRTEGEPTKTVHKFPYGEGGQKELAWEHLSSVEVGMTAKGDAQIKSVKVYGATPRPMPILANPSTDEPNEIGAWTT